MPLLLHICLSLLVQKLQLGLDLLEGLDEVVALLLPPGVLDAKLLGLVL